jgi:hypothetical protein
MRFPIQRTVARAIPSNSSGGFGSFLEPGAGEVPGKVVVKTPSVTITTVGLGGLTISGQLSAAVAAIREMGVPVWPADRAQRDWRAYFSFASALCSRSFLLVIAAFKNPRASVACC